MTIRGRILESVDGLVDTIGDDDHEERDVLMVAVLAVGLVVALAAGGSARRLGEIRLRHSWLIFSGLGLQIAVTTLFVGLSPGVSRAIHVASYGLVIGFLAANRHLTGMTVVLVGALLNFSAIVANGGTMPAQPGALRTAGIVPNREFENSAHVEDASLAFLGDVFAVPASWPFANVFSVGDVLIDLGALIVVFAACQPTWRRRSRNRAAPTAKPATEHASRASTSGSTSTNVS
jgi:Family of unknown function (DUF5317)